MSFDNLFTNHTSNSSQAETAAYKPSRTLPVWTIPFLIIAGFATLFLIVLWPQLRPATTVQVERALPFLSPVDIPAELSKTPPSSAPPEAKTMSAQGSGKLLFQAAGWLEPNPLPERISALVSGTVEKTYVTDGDKVEKGQLLAQLIDTDYKFALDEAIARQAETAAEIGLRETELETAKANLRMEAASLKASEARMQNLKDTHERYSKLSSGVVSEQALIQALQELRQQEALVNVAEAKLETGKTGVNEASARLKSAQAAHQKAEVAYQHAKLNLERCMIYSPITGRVLKMMATPGSRLNVEADLEDASTLAHLYDPNELALRMDVPIEQAGNVFVGQPAKVTCAMFPDKLFTGTVVRIAGEADIQRNALQVRIRLDNPDDMLRPSMPCRAEVFEVLKNVTSASDSGLTNNATVSSQTGGALVPVQGVINKESSPYVWIVNLDNQAVKRSITLLPSADRVGYLGVKDGVYPGDPIIINPPASLQELDRVKTDTL